jgi:hypothetical protein
MGNAQDEPNDHELERIRNAVLGVNGGTLIANGIGVVGGVFAACPVVAGASILGVIISGSVMIVMTVSRRLYEKYLKNHEYFFSGTLKLNKKTLYYATSKRLGVLFAQDTKIEMKRGRFGKGIYFSETREDAEEYNRKKERKDPVVLEVEVDLGFCFEMKENENVRFLTLGDIQKKNETHTSVLGYINGKKIYIIYESGRIVKIHDNFNY